MREWPLANEPKLRPLFNVARMERSVMREWPLALSRVTLRFKPYAYVPRLVRGIQDVGLSSRFSDPAVKPWNV